MKTAAPSGHLPVSLIGMKYIIINTEPVGPVGPGGPGNPGGPLTMLPDPTKLPIRFPSSTRIVCFISTVQVKETIAQYNLWAY